MSPIMGSDASPTSGLRLSRRREIGGVHFHLEQAQQFSIFAVEHVEEVRRALVHSLDTQTLISDDSSNAFGGSKGAEITAAFQELTAAYNKLSSLKWDAARVEFEESHRAKAGFATNCATDTDRHKGSKAEKRVQMMPVSDTVEHIIDSRGVKDHPWQENNTNPHDWIADAFLKEVPSSCDDEVSSFPMNKHLASLNATAEPFPITSPPGFKSEESKKAEDQQGKEPAHAKPTMQSFTSILSEISSLHGSSYVNTDECDSQNDEDLGSEYSDMSSSSEERPSMENFDYLYKGGYAMQVSGGKETKGVVPKSVKRVLVDSSVKVIEEGAFQGCNLLDTITVPSTVEAVGDHAFRKCSKLKNVIFLTRAPKLRRRKRLLNQKHDEKKEEKQLYFRSGHSPLSVTGQPSSRLRSIGEWAFFNCSSLVNVKLPHGLKTIGNRAFQRCSSLSIVYDKLPKTLTSVGENAFNGCPPQTKAAFERWEKTIQARPERDKGQGTQFL